jgi:hypothetical protein
MKKLAFIFLSLALSCTSATKSNGKSNVDATPLKEPKVDIQIRDSNIPKGLASLVGRNVKALFIYNLPDSYLIKAKTLFNPPDYALQEVLNLQTDRKEWFDEMIVTFCGECKNIQVDIPIKSLKENDLLYFIDKSSLSQDFTEADMLKLAKDFKGVEVLWVILGSENYEQKRAATAESTMVSAMAENTVTLRNFLYDLKTKKWLHRGQFSVSDRDFAIYERADEKKKPKVLTDQIRGQFWPMPVGASYDSPKYDEQYPYPPVPESSFLAKKALSAIGESLTP